MAAQHSLYITVLNACAILFDLPLNLTDFMPVASFFENARRPMDIIQSEQTSWKLIWAFPRCNNFVSSDQQPAQDRRFTETVSNNFSMLRLRESRLNLGLKPSIDAAEQHQLYQYFYPGLGRPHGNILHWDMTTEDIAIRIPALTAISDYTPELTRDKVERRYNRQHYLNSCQELRRRMAEVKDTKTASDLRDFGQNSNLTCDFCSWLLDAGHHKSPTGAFGKSQRRVCILAACVRQLCQDKGSGSVARRILRAGRPLLVSLGYERHFVLLVVQLNDEGQPTFAILNSLNHHLPPAARQDLHNWTRNIIPVSQQPSEAECGYYVILNAWILALGLQPNPRVRVDWSDGFFENLMDLVHLTRMGYTSWDLICTFLKCNDLVLLSEVPNDRRFVKLEELRNDSADHLGIFLDEQTDMESYQAMTEADAAPTTSRLTLESIKTTNRCNISEGISHLTGTFYYDA
ncbi:hypothetical protein T440DRAFT_511574 [Plenodomus tracheiphilus IPT5]|uniref:Ubiquitin-like protease family profile domain-containing protein n=1 Tax=Plenodomus tracheiphilus IPT5 TaxID=1408161 RepID=A0A6A7ATR4_9PLEO|nr:hypothetical protein T440DRAFT_511574 [Plenodomus tracheiphilus IPT5]